MRERLATVALSDWSRAAGGPEGWDNSATAALITPLYADGGQKSSDEPGKEKDFVCVSCAIPILDNMSNV